MSPSTAAVVDRLPQPVELALAHQPSTGPPHRPGHLGGVVVGEHHHGHCGHVPTHPAGYLGAVRTGGHPVVDHEHIRVQLPAQLEGGGAVGRTPHDLVTLEAQIRADEVERIGVVVGYHHPSGGHVTSISRRANRCRQASDQSTGEGPRLPASGPFSPRAVSDLAPVPKAVHIPVLVVDDMDDMRALVRLVVRTANEGLVVAGEAANGSEAIELADTLDPAVIVLDELMPGLGGLETARQILARRPDQRIILFSAYLDDRIQDAARELGITTCLSKVDYESLPDVIRAAAA